MAKVQDEIKRMREVLSLQASRHNIKSMVSPAVQKIAFPAGHLATPGKIGCAKENFEGGSTVCFAGWVFFISFQSFSLFSLLLKIQAEKRS